MKTSTNTAQHPKKHLFAAIFKPKERSLTLSIDNLDVLGADTDDDENSSGSERMRSFSATNPPSPTLSASIPGHISPLSNSQKPATPQSPNRAPLESWDSGVWDTRWVPEEDPEVLRREMEEKKKKREEKKKRKEERMKQELNYRASLRRSVSTGTLRPPGVDILNEDDGGLKITRSEDHLAAPDQNKDKHKKKNRSKIHKRTRSKTTDAPPHLHPLAQTKKPLTPDGTNRGSSSSAGDLRPDLTAGSKPAKMEVRRSRSFDNQDVPLLDLDTIRFSPPLSASAKSMPNFADTERVYTRYKRSATSTSSIGNAVLRTSNTSRGGITPRQRISYITSPQQQPHTNEERKGTEKGKEKEKENEKEKEKETEGNGLAHTHTLFNRGGVAGKGGEGAATAGGSGLGKTDPGVSGDDGFTWRPLWQNQKENAPCPFCAEKDKTIAELRNGLATMRALYNQLLNEKNTTTNALPIPTILTGKGGEGEDEDSEEGGDLSSNCTRTSSIENLGTDSEEGEEGVLPSRPSYRRR